jgi:hypothetical protein
MGREAEDVIAADRARHRDYPSAESFVLPSRREACVCRG